MTLGELIELLTDTLGMDLSSDSTDAERDVYVSPYPVGRLREVQGVQVEQDGAIVLVATA